MNDVNGDQTNEIGHEVLSASNITKTYGSSLPFSRTVEVLTGASIEVFSGEIVGIVGENGSGKSTLMKILVGVLDQDDGEVNRGGTIGWCPQETLLYDRLTVRETFRLFGTGYGLDEDEIATAMDNLGNRLDFDQYSDFRIDQLSGGNRQKVNLGIALMHHPDVLLLDEPYTGFDWETYQTFWEMSENLVGDGTAIVIISHLLQERDRIDRVYELEDGTLSEVDD